ncbi:GNAT family N-acetyltransferase [Spirillospora sp. NPDC047279]|uniref:GNAT family N-acetyltransferase n=1 Tax=Spirillospora sp. NPDC047279 TaxID=3155478 RepID=UPI0033D6F643
MKETVIYVEMTARDQLIPSAPVSGLTLEPLDADSPLVTDVMARIGAPYNWESTARTPEGWTAWFAEHPDRSFWLVAYEGSPAGMVSFDFHPGDEVEIGTFGLLPEYVGKGLGGYALTLGVEKAWETASRVWLHTSTFDHPNALRNYHRRGFTTYRTEEGNRTKP